MSSLRVEHSGPTLTLNKSMGMAYGAHSRIIKSWREDIAWIALAESRKMPRLQTPVEIHCDIEQSKKGGVGDAMAHAWIIKAGIDGLRDARIIPDDNPEHVARIICHAPTRGLVTTAGCVKLTLTVIEVF